MTELSELKPIQNNNKVFDLVKLAGFDVSDWIASSNDARGYKANPKYCYEWSFVQPGKVAIFNLWFESFFEENGLIKHRANFRKEATLHSGSEGKPQWRMRATKLDKALQDSIVGNLPIRVIIIDGSRRREDDPKKASQVKKRQLDPEPWTLTHYSMANGDFELTRGILKQEFIDQFDIDQLSKSEQKRVQTSATAYYRDPKVRKAALHRAKGNCELCGLKGFEMQGGAIYLETHHVKPLSEGGPDHISNVTALCPNDHRRAHFADKKDEISQQLKLFLSQTGSGQSN